MCANTGFTVLRASAFWPSPASQIFRIFQPPVSPLPVLLSPDFVCLIRQSREALLGVSRTSYFSSFFYFPEEPAGSFRGPQESPHGSQRVHVFEIFQLFPGSSRVVRVVIVYRPSPEPPGRVRRPSPGPRGVLSEFTGAFRGAPNGCQSSQVVLDAPRSFPRRSQGPTQGFQIFQVFHGFFQVVKVYRPPRGPGVPRFFRGLPSRKVPEKF